MDGWKGGFQVRLPATGIQLCEMALKPS